MAELVKAPDLDIRDEERIAAQAIAFTCGPLNVERIDFNIGVQRELRAVVEAGGGPPPVCPELTNANPASPHTVLLEVMAWLIAIIARKINQLPYKVQVEFARLFRIELREAEAATAMLAFTVAPPAGQGVTIPAGTTVRTADEQYTFQTTADLVLAPGVLSGTVGAVRDVAGATTLSANTLTKLYDPVAFVQSVTNPEAVASGSDAESIDSALARARSYQRRGERLVSAQDIEDAIFDDVLGRNGVVKAFPFVKDGDASTPLAGHTTVVVMTNAGGAVSAAVKQRVGAVLAQAVGNQFIYVTDPIYVSFDIVADVRVTGLTPQDAIVNAVKQRLRDFYAPTAANFGKSAYQSDIIALIEGSDGIERIIQQPGGALLAQPAADVPVAPYELPKLNTIILNVVP